MNKREEEREIIREITEYAFDEDMKHEASYEEMKKIREWVTKIVELEAQEMGYKTQVIYSAINEKKLGEREDNVELEAQETGYETQVMYSEIINGKNIAEMEDKGELFLRFSRDDVDDYAGYFSVNISKAGV